MKLTIDIAIGDSVAIKGSARATPAGLIAAVVLLTAVLVPLVWITRSPKRHSHKLGKSK